MAPQPTFYMSRYSSPSSIYRKKMEIYLRKYSKLLFVAIILLETFGVYSQQPTALQPPEEDNTWWYLTLVGLALALGIVVFLKMRGKSTETTKIANAKQAAETAKKNNEMLTFDADEEMEWLRKNQNIVDRKRKKAPKVQPKMNLPKTSSVFTNNHLEKEILQELESIPLPVFSFDQIGPSKQFSQLPLSNDEALLSAIEQTHDEYEEDEAVRDLALRILMAFKTRNSVEALSQVAIYDLSAPLRSKAINVLCDFDHESVFEPILLGCADPTREVRAASARALTRLSCDRSDCWTRLIETNETGRMRQAAHAAVEGGFVERSFDRLVHRDEKHAYEAFVLMALILKSGEVDILINTIKTHRDEKVRKAVLHVFKVVNDPNLLSHLYSLLEYKNLTLDLREEIDKVVGELSLATA